MENPFERIDARLDILERHMINIKDYLNMKNPNERLTRKMICEQYHISNGTIHNAMNSGALAFQKVGSKTIFKRTDVEIWVETNNY